MSGESTFSFPIKVTAHVCANGEMWEYRVWMGDIKVGQSVFRTPNVGDSRAEHALSALRKVMAVVE